MSRVEWWTALSVDALVAGAGIAVRIWWSTSTGQTVGVGLLGLAASGVAVTLWRAQRVSVRKAELSKPG